MLGIFTTWVPSAAAQSTDPWWGRDKAMHFGVSAGLSLGGYALASLIWERPHERALAGASLALSAGIAKELWDLADHGNPSWKDLAWDGLGTVTGVGIALSVDVWLLGNDNGAAARSAKLSLLF